MVWNVRAGMALLVVWLASSVAVAQPAFSPAVSVGAAVAMNCLGYREEMPPMPPVCGGTPYGNAGPYLRPYVSIRPLDRLLVTAAAGYVEGPRIEKPICCPLSGSFPLGAVVQHERMAWHGVLTGAYVARPDHPVRAFVGGGALLFSDSIQIESRPREGPATLVTDHETGVAGVFTTGALWRMGTHVEGRASYTLARRMAATTTPDTSWRHEFAIGLAWRFGGAGSGARRRG